MNAKVQRIALIIASILMVVLFIADFLENGTFMLFRGGLVSTLLIVIGILIMVVAWIQHLRKRTM